MRSDGTAYTVVGDSNILAGVLTNANGSPRSVSYTHLDVYKRQVCQRHNPEP